MAPKVPKAQTTLQLVNQVRSLIESRQMKVSDLNLPKNQKYKTALEDYYGQTMKLITSDDTGSLMGLFADAIKQGMTATGFANALKKTDWFFKYDASNRAYQTAINNPAAAADLTTKRTNILEAVQAQAVADTGKRLDDANAKSIAEDLLKNHYDDWNTKVATNVRSSLSKMDVSQFGGNILNTHMSIRDYARKMGIAVSDKLATSYTSGILAGSMSMEGVQGELRNMALPYYGQFADRIKAGDTIYDITSPYRSMIASMLEIDPESVSFDITGAKMDPLLLKAISGDGGKPMGLFDLRKNIKQDSRWQYTRNAQEEYAGLTRDLMRMFGAGV